MYIVKNGTPELEELIGADEGTLIHHDNFNFVARKGDSEFQIYTEPTSQYAEYLRVKSIYLDGEKYTPHLTRQQKKKQIRNTILHFAHIASAQMVLDRDAAAMADNYDEEVSFVRPITPGGIHIYNGLQYIADLFNLEVTYLKEQMQVNFPITEGQYVVLYQLRW